MTTAESRGRSMQQGAIKVERVRGISDRALYRDFVDAGRPVILEDACAAWVAHKHWSLDDLDARFGSRQISLDGKATTLGSALQAIKHSTAESPAPYLRECYLPETLPELLADVAPIPGDAHNRLRAPSLPQMHQPRDRGPPELLIAPGGGRFPVLHYDIMHLHAFITQIRGSKTFWLYRPDQGVHLYPREDRPNLSRIDGFNPVDLTRWPTYAQAESTQVVVQPGETIFVPSGFWHRTWCPELSIAVTWNSVSRANWSAFVEDKYLQWSRGSPLKYALKKSYLDLLGLGLRLRDA